MHNNKERVRTNLSFIKRILLVLRSLFRSGLNLMYHFKALTKIRLFVVDSSMIWKTQLESGDLSGRFHRPAFSQLTNSAATAELQEHRYCIGANYIVLNILPGKSTPKSGSGLIVLNEAQLQNILLIYGASPFPLVVIDVTECFMASVISIPNWLNLQFTSCCKNAQNFLLISSNSRACF